MFTSIFSHHYFLILIFLLTIPFTPFPLRSETRWTEERAAMRGNGGAGECHGFSDLIAATKGMRMERESWTKRNAFDPCLGVTFSFSFIIYFSLFIIIFFLDNRCFY